MTDDAILCDVTGEPIDECEHLSLADWDEDDEGDQRHDIARDTDADDADPDGRAATFDAAMTFLRELCDEED